MKGEWGEVQGGVTRGGGGLAFSIRDTHSCRRAPEANAGWPSAVHGIESSISIVRHSPSTHSLTWYAPASFTVRVGITEASNSGRSATVARALSSLRGVSRSAQELWVIAGWLGCKCGPCDRAV